METPRVPSREELAASARGLSFAYTTSDGKSHTALEDVTLDVERGSRVILAGHNGAGKTSLLRLFAGRHKPGEDGSACWVMGGPAFFQTLGPNGVAYLGANVWQRSVAFVGSAVAFEADLAAGEMMKELQQEFRERRDELVRVLDIDLRWRMHQVSDGQRRRVQIMLGLLRPFQLLLADEVTVDLDVLARRDLMLYLRKESETRGAAVIYATHIFDGLDDWPTHIAYMAHGRVTGYEPWIVPKTRDVSLYEVMLRYLIWAREQDERQDAKTAIGVDEPRPAQVMEGFGGGHAYVAGRINVATNTTMLLARNRMDAYR